MAVYKDKNKTSDGRSWYFNTYKKDLNGINKKYKSKRYATKAEAQEAERLFLMKRDNPIHKPFYLIATDYIETLYKTNKESTGYGYESYYNNHIKDFFKNYYIDEINITILKQWQDYIVNKKLNIKTMNKAYTILNNIFNYAVKNYGLENNLVAIMDKFKTKNDEIITDDNKIRYITYDQFNNLISIIDNLQWKTFFMFLYYTGMRKGEVQALNWNDIDFDSNEIIVNKTLSVKTKDNYKITSTKNNLNRKIKMSKFLKEQLIIYKSEMMKYSDFNYKWFVFGGPRFLPQTTIDNYKHKYFEIYNNQEKDKIQEITIHEFRHSHVSLLINEYVKTSKEKNMKIDTAKFFLMMSNRMGHSIGVMQETYMHLFPTIQDEIVDLLDNL